MKENYVTKDTAVLAYKKGFRENGRKCTAPTQKMIQEWLKKERQLYVEIFSNGSGWEYTLTKVTGSNSGYMLKDIESFLFFKTPEDCLKVGLQMALKYVRTRLIPLI